MSQSLPTATYPFCAECGAPELTLERPLAACDRCCTVFYCSKECQENDWIYHRGSCNMIKAMSIEDDDIPYLSLDDTASSDDTRFETSSYCSSSRDGAQSCQDTKHPGYSSLLDDYMADPVIIERSPSSIIRKGISTPVPITPISLSSSSRSGEGMGMVFSHGNGASTAVSTPRVSIDAMSSTEQEQSDITTPLLHHLSAMEDEKQAAGRRKAFLREILNEGFARAVDYIVDAVYAESSATSTRVY